jgi:hypothetical protein
MKKDVAIFATVGLVVAFLIGSLAGNSPFAQGTRLPNVPKETQFKVSAAIVELSPQATVLAGEKPEALLNDLPGRSQIGLKLLRLPSSSWVTVRGSKSCVLRQGGAFDLSFKTADNDGAGPALQSVNAHVILETVDKLSTAETDVTGSARWTVDSRHGEGSGILGYDCFAVGGANMVPLYVKPDRSAWIVVSVEKRGS